MKRSTMAVILLAVLVQLVVLRFVAFKHSPVHSSTRSSATHHVVGAEGPEVGEPVFIPADQTLGDNTSVVHGNVRTRCGGREMIDRYDGNDFSSFVRDHVSLDPPSANGTHAKLAPSVEVVLQMNDIAFVGGIAAGKQVRMPQWCASQPLG